MPHNDAASTVAAPQTAAQRRTYPARVALARKRNGEPKSTLTFELRALRRIARALVDLTPESRHRVLGLASGYLGRPAD